MCKDKSAISRPQYAVNQGLIQENKRACTQGSAAHARPENPGQSIRGRARVTELAAGHTDNAQIHQHTEVNFGQALGLSFREFNAPFSAFAFTFCVLGISRAPLVALHEAPHFLHRERCCGPTCRPCSSSTLLRLRFCLHVRLLVAASREGVSFC
jgi:hypothetical protein